jgi:hypothetical protein
VLAYLFAQLLFDTKDGGTAFLRNIDKFLSDFAVLHSRIYVFVVIITDLTEYADVCNTTD